MELISFQLEGWIYKTHKGDLTIFPCSVLVCPSFVSCIRPSIVIIYNYLLSKVLTAMTFPNSPLSPRPSLRLASGMSSNFQLPEISMHSHHISVCRCVFSTSNAMLIVTLVSVLCTLRFKSLVPQSRWCQMKTTTLHVHYLSSMNATVSQAKSYWTLLAIHLVAFQ